MSIHFDLTQYINPVFIETGTFRGEGVKLALAAGFSKVISVEINPTFYKACYEQFAKEIEAGRVELLLGDSQYIMPNVIERLKQPATFWLDAHTQSGGKGENNCPLYEEIETIRQHPIKSHTLLIDDLRLVKVTTAWEGHNVTVDGLLERIQAINPNYRIALEDGFAPRDVLTASLGKTKAKTWSIDEGKRFFLLQRQADSLGQAGKVEAAIAKHFEALALGIDNHSSYIKLSHLYTTQGDLDAAIEHCHQALTFLTPSTPPKYRIQVLSPLAHLYELQEKFDAALDLRQQLVQLEPKKARAHANLGSVLRWQGEIEQAIAAYQQAIKLNPDQPTWVYVSLGTLLRQKQQIPAAIEAYQTAIAGQSNNPKLHLGIAKLYSEQEDWSQATYHFQQALHLQADQPAWVHKALEDARERSTKSVVSSQRS